MALGATVATWFGGRWHDGILAFARAGEIFLTGNASKVTAVTRFEARERGAGAMAARARALYWDHAHQTRATA